jgi:hypothetical protein
MQDIWCSTDLPSTGSSFSLLSILPQPTRRSIHQRPKETTSISQKPQSTSTQSNSKYKLVSHELTDALFQSFLSNYAAKTALTFYSVSCVLTRNTTHHAVICDACLLRFLSVLF